MSSALLMRTTRWLLVILLLSGRPSLAQDFVTVHRDSSPERGFLILPPVVATDSFLRFRVYNYARVDAASLANSEKVAEQIFSNVGLRVEWVDCPLSAATASKYPSCPADIATYEFVLRILPRTMAIKLQPSGDFLGFAHPCPPTERACPLTVFYDRIERLTEKGYRGDRILGYAIAHEVTHLLIGPGHSQEGIMRHEWTAQDLQRISWGMQLDFSATERSQLRGAFQNRAFSPDSAPDVAKR